MILYYSPGACSLATHIALEEAGADFTPARVTLAEGEHLKPDYLRINPHSRVPALATDGRVITENIAILNFVAQHFASEGSVPLHEPLAAARCNELLGWFASTVHIGFAQVWRAERFTNDATIHPVIEQGGRNNLAACFAEIEAWAGDDWAVPGHFTAADSYLLTFFRWGLRIGLDMAAYTRWAALVERGLRRPAVQRVLQREGLDAGQFRLTVETDAAR